MKRKTKITLTGGIGVTAVIVFLLTPVLLLALAGCGTAGESSDGDSTTCAYLGSGFRQCEITLNDTRKVTCVEFGGYRVGGGMSCDWGHAGGADREPR
ncbi:MAG: hypothetical protein E6146_09850 [Bifidobacterium sp.]|uniref:hypothetical protein n=1 Tax=Bifidobacterium sp. TaxID=41200 RepID=UPI00290688CB|nr:hypothetical protein [Bifidobacterium sp.]MDU5322734.1 hypothetical protein [Bifidobacterium sp.]MDU5899400.1 hypothetical protein [Bifidobacterium sp.]